MPQDRYSFHESITWEWTPIVVPRARLPQLEGLRFENWQLDVERAVASLRGRPDAQLRCDAVGSRISAELSEGKPEHSHNLAFHILIRHEIERRGLPCPS